MIKYKFALLIHVLKYSAKEREKASHVWKNNKLPGKCPFPRPEVACETV